MPGTPPRNPLEHARNIVVEGPIGAGKTSLARRLAEHLGKTKDCQLLLEQPELNPFLNRFYQDRSRYALQTQLFFLFQRQDQLRDLAQPDIFRQTVVSDFLFEKDPIFARLTLAEDEYKLYHQIYNTLAPQVVSPDLVIYLQASPENLIARVKKRGQEMERKIGDVYLTQLAESYSRFFYGYNAAPVLIVNSDHLNFVDRDDHFQLLLERLSAMRGHREYFNRGE
ncbi:MAG TPA: deoxynucleoside kinase [Azospira sp.]|nr:deoxynucleoside kinase [Azospira sp.]